MTDKSGAKLCKHNCVYSFFFVSPVFVVVLTPFFVFFLLVCFLRFFSLFGEGGGGYVYIMLGRNVKMWLLNRFKYCPV